VHAWSFPATHHSALVALVQGDAAQRRRALDTLAELYWKPVYKYLRLKWGRDPQAAADLTQAFFLAAIEKSFFDGYDRGRSRFRTFLRVCLDRFVQNQDAAALRLKRGGDAEILPIDVPAVEAELEGQAPRPRSVEDTLDLEWVRALLSLAVERLRRSAGGDDLGFRLFVTYDVEHAGGADGEHARSYADLAREFGVTVETVTNRLAAARRDFRRAVLDILRETTASDDEFRDEARAVLGIDPPAAADERR
jgi:RNA polymerase sigma factor (sigma-70 family)